MAKEQCPLFSARQDGRWRTFRCRSPDPCPRIGCPANPRYQEPDPDDVSG